ncbi:MAG: hypothetical protein L3J49_01010 [Desulfobulbaceae bacterium]|nr:hypothetical protein [Desulfobulbaceae bacterium]
MLQPSRKAILALLIGILTALVLLAKTDLMAPTMQFILATDRGTPLQLIGCIVAAVIGLRLVYVLLDMVGHYYSGKLDEIDQQKKKEFGTGR